MPSPTTFVFSLKFILIAAGAISIALAIRFSVPHVVDFSSYDVPLWWNSLIKWLQPPYLYFIVNVIIVIIAATSWFSHQTHPGYNSAATGGQPQPHVPLTPPGPPPSAVDAAGVLAEAPPPAAEVCECGHRDQDGSGAAEEVELKAVVVNGVHQFEEEDDDVVNDAGWIVPKPDCSVPQRIAAPEEEEANQLDNAFPVKEEPLVLSTRFRHHIKPAKTGSSPEGRRAVRIEEMPKRREQQHDTLDDTWKMITEGAHAPPARQLKKSDTWDNRGCKVVLNSLDLPDLPPPQHVKKSTTFRDRTNCLDNASATPPPPPPQPAKIRKEPSLSQEEVNRRAEEFIKKFNEEMRLQRQESLDQYIEMINRGAC